jgi:hypothetical protein
VQSATAYKWYRNNVEIIGATSQTYYATTSGSYTVRVGNAANCFTESIAVSVTAVPKPAKPNVLFSGDTELCDGEQIMFTSSAVSNNQWYKDGSAISGATGQNIVVATTGSFTVEVSSLTNCSTSSDAVQVNMHPLPAQPTITVDSLTLTSSSANAYQWYKDENIIVNATTQNYTVSSTGSYKVRIKDLADCEAFSDTVNFLLSGISNYTNQIIQVYPNPVKDILRVSGIGYRVTVYNYLGEKVMERELVDGQINVSSLPTGIYILKTEEGIARFVKY